MQKLKIFALNRFKEYKRAEEFIKKELLQIINHFTIFVNNHISLL